MESADWFQWSTEGLLICTIGVVGLIGNVGSVVIFARRRVQRIFHRLLLVLATFDTVYIISSIILFSLPMFIEGYMVNVKMYILPYFLPIIHMALVGSIYSTVALAVERYIAVCHPFVRYRGSYKSIVYILPVVLFSFTYTIPKFFELRLVDAAATPEAFNATVAGPAGSGGGDVVGPWDRDDVAAHHARGKGRLHMVGLVPTELRQSKLYVRIYLICANFVVQLLVPFAALIVLNLKTYRTIKESERNLLNNYRMHFRGGNGSSSSRLSNRPKSTSSTIAQRTSARGSAAGLVGDAISSGGARRTVSCAATRATSPAQALVATRVVSREDGQVVAASVLEASSEYSGRPRVAVARQGRLLQRSRTAVSYRLPDADVAGNARGLAKNPRSGTCRHRRPENLLRGRRKRTVADDLTSTAVEEIAMLPLIVGEGRSIRVGQRLVRSVTFRNNRSARSRLSPADVVEVRSANAELEEVEHCSFQEDQQQQQQQIGNKATSLRKREVVLSRISFYIIFLFLFCHSLRIVPNLYEMVWTYTQDDGANLSFPKWVQRFTNASHFMITLSCSANFYIYFAKYSGLIQWGRRRRPNRMSRRHNNSRYCNNNSSSCSRSRRWPPLHQGPSPSISMRAVEEGNAGNCLGAANKDTEVPVDAQQSDLEVLKEAIETMLENRQQVQASVECVPSMAGARVEPD